MSKIEILPMKDAPRDGTRIMLVLISGNIASGQYVKCEPPKHNCWHIHVSGASVIDTDSNFSPFRGWYPFPEFEQIPNYGGETIPKTESGK